MVAPNRYRSVPMKRCVVKNLYRGDCPEYPVSDRGDGLCYYHGKLEDGLLVPPGDYVDNKEFPSVAAHARVGYERSTHPHFAQLVDFGRSVKVGRSMAAA
jgi:hypothetical protein